MRQFLLTLIALTGVSCADQHNSLENLKAKSFETAKERVYLSANQTLQVVDADGTPIGSAEVMVGHQPGDPFSGNVLKSDQNGLVEIPSLWKAELPVTVTAPGYVAKTIPAMTPQPATIHLSQQEGHSNFEIKGDTTQFGRLITDGKVDFALVMPTLSRNQLLNFDVSMMVSPEMDKISVIGNEADIPSNVTLPEQTENYIFPVRLNKPTYRNFVRDPGTYQFFASRGNFPIRKVVDDIRAGKSIFEEINYFNFIGGGFKNVTINGDIAGQDIAVNELTFNATIPVKAPAFADDKMIISISLAEKNGLMTPFDLKRLTSSMTLNLKTVANWGASIVVSLMLPNTATNQKPVIDMELIKAWPLGVPLLINPMANQDFSELSFNVQSANGAVTPSFIEGLKKPVATSSQLKMTVPARPSGMNAVATYAVLSEIETIGSGNLKSERRTRLWEMMSPGWVSAVDLPKFSLQKNPNRTYRWDVMFMGSTLPIGTPIIVDDKVDLSKITHVTRNATDF